MASRAIGAVIAIVFALGSVASALPQIREQTGEFAFYAAQQRAVARLRRIGGDELDLVQMSMQTGAPIRNYTSVAGAPVHFFLIRDDFRSFMHVHPQVRSDGHFLVHVTLEPNHRYYAYVDSFPRGGIGEQAFRFTLQRGSPPHHLATTIAQPNAVATAGPYRIALSTDRFRANAPVTISATVKRGDTVVKLPDQRPFKTVAAIVNTGSLSYTSVYNDPNLRLPPLPAGVYRMWLELNIAGRAFSVPFTLAAQ